MFSGMTYLRSNIINLSVYYQHIFTSKYCMLKKLGWHLVFPTHFSVSLVSHMPVVDAFSFIKCIYKVLHQ